MALPIDRLLQDLYGAEPGREAARQWFARLEDWCPRLKNRTLKPTAPTLTERDALLITYADQVQQPGQPPLRTLAEFCEARLRDTVSGVHLLPFYPWSSDDGFAVKDYFAVDPAMGTWEDVKRLGGSFDLMFDAVFNHLSAQGDWFQRFLRDEPEFREFFVTVHGHPDLSQVVRPRALPLLTEFAAADGPRQVWTTFSADQVDLNFKNPRVLLAVLEAMLFYVSKGARFIRLDAIAFLWKEIGTPCLHLRQTHAIIQLMRAVLAQVAPHVQIITETNVPHTDNLSYFGDGTNEAQLVYNFALPPLVLHSFATGSAEQLTRWAHSLVLPSPQVTFFNFLASHDGIGLNPARGILSNQAIDALVQRARTNGGLVSYKQNPDGSQSAYELNISWFDALNDPASEEPITVQVDRFMTSQAVLLALPGVPGIYFHSLFGSRNDRRAADVTGIARRINRQKLPRAALETELADPTSLRARVFSRFRQLLHARRGLPAFHPQAQAEVLALDARVFTVVRTSADQKQQVFCAHNVGEAPVEIRLPQGLLETQPTHAIPLDGQEHAQPLNRSIRLGPYQFAWLVCQ